MALALVAGTAVSTWQAIRATQAERAALQDRDAATAAREAEGLARKRAEDAEKTARGEADKARAINEFLVNDLLARAEPGKNHDLFVGAEPGQEAAAGRITLREALDRAAEKVGKRFRDLPLVEAALRTTISDTYHGLQTWAESRKQAAVASGDLRAGEGSGAAETLNGARRLGHALDDERKFVEAEQLLRRSLDGLSRLLGEDHPDTLQAMNDLAEVYQDQGKLAEAEALYIKTLDGRRRTLGECHDHTLETTSRLAGLYGDQGKPVEAEARPGQGGGSPPPDPG